MNSRRDVTCGIARQSYAIEVLRAGVNLPLLMKLLGHESPK
jgi:site-specific recombinase XerD